MTEDINELKAYVEGILHGKVIMEQMGSCKICGKQEDLRQGVCFDCSVPACLRHHCPFRKLVYCGQGNKRVFVDLTYKGLQGKIYCDRDEGICSDREFAIGLDKEKGVPCVSENRIRRVK
jgi:hypothetical protein